jgi:hypothetical protein
MATKSIIYNSISLNLLYIIVGFIFIALIVLLMDRRRSYTPLSYILREKNGFDNRRLYKELKAAKRRWEKSIGTTGHILFIDRGRNMDRNFYILNCTLEDIEPYLKDPFDSFRTKAWINIFLSSQTAVTLNANQGSSRAVRINRDLICSIKYKRSPQ